MAERAPSNMVSKTASKVRETVASIHEHALRNARRVALLFGVFAPAVFGAVACGGGENNGVVVETVTPNSTSANPDNGQIIQVQTTTPTAKATESPTATATATATPEPPTPEPAPQIEDLAEKINKSFGNFHDVDFNVTFYFNRAKGRIDAADPNSAVIWNDLLSAGKRGKPLVCGPSGSREMFAAYNNLAAFTVNFIKKDPLVNEGAIKITEGIFSLPAECTSRFK